jgi:membrane-associated protein
MVCAAVGACVGAQVGYYIGRRGGRAMLARSHSVRLKEVVTRGEELLARYGQRKAILLGRFIPMVRTVLGPVAGVLEVPVKTYTLWQVVAGIIWSQSLVLLGYWLGAAIPGVDNYLLPLVALVVVVSFLPVLLQRRKRSH